MTIKIIRPKYRYGIKFFSLDFGLVIWDLGFFSFGGLIFQDQERG